MPNSLTSQFNEIILSISHKEYVDPNYVEEFEKRLLVPGLTRDENPETHFCTFCAPVDVVKKKIFLIHHIKGNDWMPPGGHIDLGELPKQTVIRELFEELGYKITDEKIELFDITTKDVANDKTKCKKHFDFWYFIHIPEQPLHADRKECTDEGWFTFEEAYEKMKTPVFRRVISKLPENLTQ